MTEEQKRIAREMDRTIWMAQARAMELAEALRLMAHACSEFRKLSGATTEGEPQLSGARSCPKCGGCMVYLSTRTSWVCQKCGYWYDADDPTITSEGIVPNEGAES